MTLRFPAFPKVVGDVGQFERDGHRYSITCITDSVWRLEEVGQPRAQYSVNIIERGPDNYSASGLILGERIHSTDLTRAQVFQLIA
jgi:hypothetical protein